jgi:hypothetical protein
MAHTVGPKGQVVIEKAIREKLGVRPGWQALQLLAGDHVAIYFVPPPHNRSLAGCLAPYLPDGVPVEDDDDAWDQAIACAVAEEYAAAEEEKSGS